jgi:hypothetical protein
VTRGYIPAPSEAKVKRASRRSEPRARHPAFGATGLEALRDIRPVGPLSYNRGLDPVRNPYTPGAGTRPPALAGRDGEIERFEVLLQRLAAGRYSRSFLITGLRGVGKTVLLNEFARRATDAKWFVATSEVRTSGKLAGLVTLLARGALLEMSRVDRIKDRAMRALGVLKAFVVTVGDVEVRLDVDAITGKGDSGDLERDLGDVIVELGSVAQEAGTGVALLLDEVQLLERQELEALMAALHRTAQENLPIGLVGVGLPLLPKLTGEAKSYAERLFEFRSIGSLDRAAADEALASPATAEGVTFEGAALERIYDYSRGYPYFLQEYGKTVWDYAEGPEIESADVDGAHDVVLEELDRGFFHVRIERTPTAERQYLAAIADLGDGPQRSGDVAKKLGYPTVSGPSLVRDNLLKKGLIYSPRHGYVDFTVPLFGDYLRRNFAFDPENIKRRRRTPRSQRDFGDEVKALVGEVLGSTGLAGISYGDSQEDFDYEAVELTTASDVPEEIIAYFEVISAETARTSLDDGLWRAVEDRITKTPERFAIVISECPVKIGADSHLAPRISVTTLPSDFVGIDETRTYILDLSGNVGVEDRRELLSGIREDIVRRTGSDRG